MFDLSTIKSMNKAKEAKKEKLEPFIIYSLNQIDKMPPFPFPNIGSYKPKGWKLFNKYFVDSSGLGNSGEPALTIEAFMRKLKIGYGYAIIEAGQFQVYVGEYKRE